MRQALCDREEHLAFGDVFESAMVATLNNLSSENIEKGTWTIKKGCVIKIEMATRILSRAKQLFIMSLNIFRHF